MNILVTGANGFVGRTLCYSIAHNGLKPYGLVRKTQEWKPVASVEEGLEATARSFKG